MRSNLVKCLLFCSIFSILTEPLFAQRRRRRPPRQVDDQSMSLTGPAPSLGTEYIFGFNLLDFRHSSTELDPDEGESNEQSSSTIQTAAPGFALSVFDPQYALILGYEYGTASSGTILGGVNALHPNLYVGAYFQYESANTEVDNGATTTDSESSSFVIGPAAVYRVRTEATMLEGMATLFYLSAEDASENETSAFGAVIGGSYYKKFLSKLYLGAGAKLTYGSGEREVGGTDVDLSTLLFELHVLRLRLVF